MAQAHRTAIGRIVVASALALAVSGSAPSSRGAPPEETVPSVRAPSEQPDSERARQVVTEALELYHRPAQDGDEVIDQFVTATDSLVEFGPGAVPLLIFVLEEQRPATFKFAAYALGRLDTPESTAALRAAMDRAEQVPGDLGIMYKAWAGWALGLHHEVDALDRFNVGRSAAYFSIHNGMSVLEAAALQTAPESVPVLLAQLDRAAKDEQLRPTRRYVARALGRLADPAAVPALTHLLGDADASASFEAARALGAIETPESAAGLLSALESDQPMLRRGAALSLALQQPQGKLQPLLARLEVETDPVVRATLYRTVAAIGGERVLETLRAQLGRQDPVERQALVDAVASIEGRAAVELLRGFLNDANVAAAGGAVGGLARHPGPVAGAALIEAAGSPSWPVALTAIEQLQQTGESRVASPLGERLVRELAVPFEDPAQFDRIRTLGEALVELGAARALPELRRTAQREGDSANGLYLQALIRRMEWIEKNGNRVERWSELAASDDLEQRTLAYLQLGRIGGEPAAHLVAEEFRRADGESRLALLTALGADASPSAQGLIEHILLDPEFDPSSQLGLREQAAWNARRIGGARMREALRAAIARRHGREAKLLIYLGLTEGKDALPTLAAYRLPRLHYLKWSRGKEQEALDQLARDLKAGRSVSRLDVPPDRIQFR